jgi:hypothetical protein
VNLDLTLKLTVESIHIPNIANVRNLSFGFLSCPIPSPIRSVKAPNMEVLITGTVSTPDLKINNGAFEKNQINRNKFLSMFFKTKPHPDEDGNNK